jgi:hypothetical protein
MVNEMIDHRMASHARNAYANTLISLEGPRAACGYEFRQSPLGRSKSSDRAMIGVRDRRYLRRRSTLMKSLQQQTIHPQITRTYFSVDQLALRVCW